MKELEGKQVYLIPTGNNARGKNSETTVATITKVARVYLYLTSGDYNTLIKFRYQGNRLDNGYNGGYMVFESQEAVDDYRLCKKLALAVGDKFRYVRDWETLPQDKLMAVAKILEVEVNE